MLEPIYPCAQVPQRSRTKYTYRTFIEQCDIYVYMTIYKVQYIPLIARGETPGKTWLPYPRAGEMTTVVVAATRSDIKGARESRAAQVWGCVTFTPPGFVSVSNPSRVPRLSASDARNPNKATVRPPRRQRRIARPVSRYSRAITMPNPRRITARHKSQFDSRATGNSDRITRLVHAHCLLFECNENMAETVEVALSRCGRRKQPNPRRKNGRRTVSFVCDTSSLSDGFGRQVSRPVAAPFRQ